MQNDQFLDHPPVVVQYNTCPPLDQSECAYQSTINSKLVNRLLGTYDKHYEYTITLTPKDTSKSPIVINDRYSNLWNVVNALRTMNPNVILPHFPEKGEAKLSVIDEKTLQTRSIIFSRFFVKIAENNLLEASAVYSLFQNPKLPDEVIKDVKKKNDEWEKLSKEKENHLQALLDNYKEINEDYALLSELERKFAKIKMYLEMRQRRSNAFKKVFETFDQGMPDIPGVNSERKQSIDEDITHVQSILTDLNNGQVQQQVAAQYEHEDPQIVKIESIIEEMSNEARNFLKYFQIGFLKIVRERSINLPGEGFKVSEPVLSEAFAWSDLTESQRAEQKIDKRIISYQNASTTEQKVFAQLSNTEKQTIDILEFQISSFLRNIIFNFKYILEELVNFEKTKVE